MVSFRGFPPEAIAFFEGLEADNSKAYWTEHKAEYEEGVRGPMEELIAAVDQRYQPLRIVPSEPGHRASPRTRRPYKTDIGAVGEAEGGTDVLRASSRPEGLFAGSGYYHMATDQLTRFREAVDDDTTGAECRGLVAARWPTGHVVGAHDELKTAPRGLRQGPPPHRPAAAQGPHRLAGLAGAAWLHTAKAKDRVEGLWARCRPRSTPGSTPTSGRASCRPTTATVKPSAGGAVRRRHAKHVVERRDGASERQRSWRCGDAVGAALVARQQVLDPLDGDVVAQGRLEQIELGPAEALAGATPRRTPGSGARPAARSPPSSSTSPRPGSPRRCGPRPGGAPGPAPS